MPLCHKIKVMLLRKCSLLYHILAIVSFLSVFHNPSILSVITSKASFKFHGTIVIILYIVMTTSLISYTERLYYLVIVSLLTS